MVWSHVGGQLRYEDYLGNVATLAVEMANSVAEAPRLSSESRALLGEHGVAMPSPDELVELLPLLRHAVEGIVDGAPTKAVSRLLRRYPPRLCLADHDGRLHLHFAADGTDPAGWIGQSCAAALAQVACGDPAVTLGRCQARGCARLFVDQSRNRSRRFCGNTCASRTTVAAYRARQRPSTPSP
jgi:predicted RNA-binding Zn ribbon-like protein